MFVQASPDLAEWEEPEHNLNPRHKPSALKSDSSWCSLVFWIHQHPESPSQPATMQLSAKTTARVAPTSRVSVCPTSSALGATNCNNCMLHADAGWQSSCRGQRRISLACSCLRLLGLSPRPHIGVYDGAAAHLPRSCPDLAHCPAQPTLVSPAVISRSAPPLWCRPAALSRALAALTAPGMVSLRCTRLWAVPDIALQTCSMSDLLTVVPRVSPNHHHPSTFQVLPDPAQLLPTAPTRPRPPPLPGQPVR